MSAVAVLGASGFVGSALVKHLRARGDRSVKALIHSSGNAWELARYGLTLHQIDVMSPLAVDKALDGCTHVVNCTRGSADVMVEGLKNILASCRRLRVERFVHLSSVSVYDGAFPAEPISEAFDGRAEKGTYGGKKSQQDDLVRAAARRGLSAAVLCPPNISGARSPFLVELVSLLREGRFALVGAGEQACNLIDVENLVGAIHLALECPAADAERIFVTDDVTPTWSDVARSLQPVAGGPGELPSVSVDEARVLCAEQKQKISVTRAMRHLVSSDVRAAMRGDPALALIEGFAKGCVKQLPGGWTERLSPPRKAPAKTHARLPYSQKPIRQQLRTARYAIDRAEEVLGYRPVVDTAESFRMFRKWYTTHFATNSDFADLLYAR